MGFTRAELESYVDSTVPDLVWPDLRLPFVGINPGLWTAATQTHFAHPGNRFYPALLAARTIERSIDRGVGMSAADREHILERGIAISIVVHRATAKASELSTEELREGGVLLREFVCRHRPIVVVVAGITAYRTAFGVPKARMGEQAELIEGPAHPSRRVPTTGVRHRSDPWPRWSRQTTGSNQRLTCSVAPNVGAQAASWAHGG